MSEPMPASKDRFVRLDAVLSRVPVGRSTLYRMMAEGAFPKSVKLGSMTCWAESEIDRYVEEKLNSRS